MGLLTHERLLMINLSNLPIWVIPSIILFIFGLGISVTQFLSKNVSKREFVECQEKRIRNDSINNLREDLNRTKVSLVKIENERTEIWEYVRTTEKNVEVLKNDMAWVKDTLIEIKEAVR